MTINLKELERRAFRSTFEDGIWDIYLGLVFVIFGFVPFLRTTLGISEGVAITIHIALLVPSIMVLILGKQYITAPRLGTVTFRKERQRKLSGLKIVLGLSVVVGLITFALISTNQLNISGFWLVFAGMIIVVMGSMALLMDYNRLFFYAILWAISMPIGVWMEGQGMLSDAPMTFIVTGGLAVVVGLVYLQSFLKNYHLPPKDEQYG
jgi:hypothetical protein